MIDSLDPTAPCIGWKILLPSQWNLRSVQIGGGANNGNIPSLEGPMLMSNYRPIERGYVVFGDDSGHQSADPMSADFAANEESLQNYIRHHLIKMNGVMHVVVKAAYGVDAEKVYFAGGSAGGREALECTCSYGKDYDGVFCTDPVSNFVLLRMWGALLSKAVYDSYDEKTHLEWLDTWCTEGEYPSETLYGIIDKTGGEMPMATFPGWVKYKSGDPMKGTSYEVSYEIPEGFFDKFA